MATDKQSCELCGNAGYIDWLHRPCSCAEVEVVDIDAEPDTRDHIGRKSDNTEDDDI